MATERRSEAIWIESKGYWQVKVQKNGERKAFTSPKTGRKGKHEAEAKADKWLESGTKEMRVSDGWQIFLNYTQEHTGSSNYTNTERNGRLYILPKVGNYKLSAMTPIRWQSCIDAGVEAGLSRRSCVNIRQSISAFITYARRARWTVDPLERGDLTVSNEAAPAKQKTVLQPKDIETLFSSDTVELYGKPQPAHYIYAWRFMVVTGLRRGELCGLRKEDLKNGVLHIRRSINSFGEETRGKNDNARRDIALPQLALQIVQQENDMLADKGIVSPWLFPDEHGECIEPHTLFWRWDRYRKQHGIESSLHELRHTFVSVSKADMPIELLKSMVGHSVQMDTTGIYGHEIDGEKERTAQIIDTVFDRLLRQTK